MHDYLVAHDPMKRLRHQPDYGPTFTKELIDQVSENQGKIYIAQNHTTPIGFVAGFIETQSDDNLLEVIPTKLGVITDIFVNESNRTSGVGKLLITEIETYLKSAGCDSLWLNVNSFNPAHNFYQKQGYQDRQIGMLKMIK
jgi:ribosomal protein S18 acetylase RimI-like enzyme